MPSGSGNIVPFPLHLLFSWVYPPPKIDLSNFHVVPTQAPPLLTGPPPFPWTAVPLFFLVELIYCQVRFSGKVSPPQTEPQYLVCAKPLPPLVGHFLLAGPLFPPLVYYGRKYPPLPTMDPVRKGMSPVDALVGKGTLYYLIPFLDFLTVGNPSVCSIPRTRGTSQEDPFNNPNKPSVQKITLLYEKIDLGGGQ